MTYGGENGVTTMSRTVLLDDVRRLLERGAQLVEVLDHAEYERLHLAGAVNIPLDELGQRAPAELDPARPVVVYCYDALCDMSPRAAHRLDILGFGEVYDYVPGKVDWCANSLPCEGAEAGLPRIGSLVHLDVPTCGPDENIRELHDRIGDWDVCVVVDEHRVVLGVVRAEVFAVDADRPVAEVMQEGPSTYRPDVTVDEMADELAHRPQPRVLVTNADGALVGIAAPEEIERAAKARR
jgi:rhodanese-related sulfurtransferase